MFLKIKIIALGYVSKNYIERVHEGYTSGTTSSYVVGGGIAIAVLAILLIAFAVIAVSFFFFFIKGLIFAYSPLFSLTSIALSNPCGAKTSFLCTSVFGHQVLHL